MVDKNYIWLPILLIVINAKLGTPYRVQLVCQPFDIVLHAPGPRQKSVFVLLIQRLKVDLRLRPTRHAQRASAAGPVEIHIKQICVMFKWIGGDDKTKPVRLII